MSEVSTWRARAYWALATVLLPLVNPVAFAFGLNLGNDDGQPWIPVVLLIAVVNAALLRLAGGRLWKRPETRRWRVALAVGLAIALSVVYGALELYALIWISCHHGGCFN
jgi:cation transport ATPase